MGAETMLLMSIGSAASSYIGGQQAAANAAEAANAQNRAAWENYNIQRVQLEQEAIQSGNQAMVEKSERAKQLLLEQSKIQTMAGEAGIAGTSVNALLQDSYMQAGIDVATIETNRQSRNIQRQSQQQASYAQAKDTMNRAQREAQAVYDKAPSLLGTAFKIGTDYGNSSLNKSGSQVK